MSNDRNAQELLKWGLANSNSSSSSTAVAPVASQQSIDQISADIQAGRRPDLSDPNLYNAIMGKSESQMMSEELSVATNPSLPLSDRLTALDNFEMLIEQIDNANNITSLKMWQPIISLLTAEEPEIQTAAAWIVGTAVQNNDKAQMAILDFQPVQSLLELLGSGVEEVRGKAMYALSGLLKHNPVAMDQFDRLDGWKVLRESLLDPNLGVRRKTAFLINSLLFQDPNTLDSASTSTPVNSTATAIAPVAPARSSQAADAPPVPLERGPATQLTSTPHPNVSLALLTSRILPILISSLLPHSDLLPPPSGPDGDTDPQTDLDFSEKAATSILTFTAKLPTTPTHLLDDQTRSLLKELRVQLEGPPLDTADGAKTRWQELGIDQSDFDTFKQKVQSL
ncbi:Hsp70 nucleotide exchange factor FES1 [Pseudozyma hubeiensis]|nr:Hsp70 nucleotide exchange factor FES1 [Pseudozyma hubeiensis]